jgi:hypothetical protein
MGSKIPQTTCYTKEELERLEEKSKKILEKGAANETTDENNGWR